METRAEEAPALRAEGGMKRWLGNLAVVALCSGFLSPAPRPARLDRLFAAQPGDVDPFDVLGVSRDVSAAELKRAYRRVAMRAHPDVNKAPDAAEQFKRIVAAYETLSDPKQRSKYCRKHPDTSRRPPPRRAATRGTAARGAAPPPPRESRVASPTEDYDAGGDSFGAIFADLARTVSEQGAAASGRGVVEDLVDFLERTAFDDDEPEGDDRGGSEGASDRGVPGDERKAPGVDASARVDTELARLKREMGLRYEEGRWRARLLRKGMESHAASLFSAGGSRYKSPFIRRAVSRGARDGQTRG